MLRPKFGASRAAVFAFAVLQGAGCGQSGRAVEVESPLVLATLACARVRMSAHWFGDSRQPDLLHELSRLDRRLFAKQRLVKLDAYFDAAKPGVEYLRLDGGIQVIQLTSTLRRGLVLRKGTGEDPAVWRVPGLRLEFSHFVAFKGEPRLYFQIRSEHGQEPPPKTVARFLESVGPKLGLNRYYADVWSRLPAESSSTVIERHLSEGYAWSVGCDFATVRAKGEARCWTQSFPEGAGRIVPLPE